MHILVLLKMVPDVVEDLEIAPDGKALDLEYLRMILSESDDHALEQALLLKERHGGKVTVLALDAPEVDDAPSKRRRPYCANNWWSALALMVVSMSKSSNKRI